MIGQKQGIDPAWLRDELSKWLSDLSPEAKSQRLDDPRSLGDYLEIMSLVAEHFFEMGLALRKDNEAKIHQAWLSGQESGAVSVQRTAHEFSGWTDWWDDPEVHVKKMEVGEKFLAFLDKEIEKKLYGDQGSTPKATG